MFLFRKFPNSVKANRNGDLCKLIFQTSPSFNNYYCGEPLLFCSCGKSCKTCGSSHPRQGCRCLTCLEISDPKYELCTLRLNGSGFLARLCSDGKYYCGQIPKEDCIQCSPATGRACQACQILLGEPPDSFGRNGKGFFCRVGENGYYYCGRIMNQCRCGRCADGRCGLMNGCPCKDCYMLAPESVKVQPPKPKIKNEFKIPRPTKPLRHFKAPSDSATTSVKFWNKNGYECRRGSASETYGGDTGMFPKDLFYCGYFMNECRCGQCDGECGPKNGCPCAACLELAFDLANGEEQEVFASAPPAEMVTFPPTLIPEPDEIVSESQLCVICLVAKKNCIALPCGHYNYCGSCAKELNHCALCRVRITSFNQVFEA